MVVCELSSLQEARSLGHARRRARARRPSSSRLRRGLLAFALMLLAVTASATARAAQPPSYQDRQEARRLGKEGLELFEAKRFADALDRFERANELLPAPTLGLRAARCLVELGRLVEASERYLEVSRFELRRVSPQVHFAARREARQERDALLPRIPTLEVDVPEADPESLLVRVNGERLPPTLLGQPQPFDPGKQAIVVQRGTTQVSTSVLLSEGDDTRVIIELPGSPAYRQVAPPDELTPYRKWGVVSLAAGGGAAAIAAVNGMVTLWLHDQLAEQCVDGCLPEQHGTNDLYKATGAITTVGMVVAGLGFAAGTTLLIVDPGAEPKLAPAVAKPATATVRPWIGPASVGLSGRF